MTLLNEFTVIDLETTGLYAGGHDRIVEVSAIRFEGGEITDSFSTLVNPKRDIGPTQVHGIRARDVVDAPTFEEIAGDVILQMEHVVISAHNIRFDLGFLTAELHRIGYELPEVPTLCTLHLSHLLPIGGINRKLGTCCRQMDIQYEGPHQAANDATATGRLLVALLALAERRGIKSLTDLGCDIARLSTEVWPPLAASGKRFLRPEGIASWGTSYIADLVDRLPSRSDQGADATAYLDLLDRALEDRRVTKDEADGLLATAEQWGISRQRVDELHRLYLADLIQVALEDWHVSSSERTDLEEVTWLLGLKTADLESGLGSAMIGMPPSRIPEEGQDLHGKTVCFTGSLTCRPGEERITREMATHLAEGAGLIVVGSVTKGLDLLVVADADTQSGKARKARQLGVRVVAEAAFWQMLHVQVE